MSNFLGQFFYVLRGKKNLKNVNNGKNLVEFKINPTILITVLLVTHPISHPACLIIVNKEGIILQLGQKFAILNNYPILDDLFDRLK